ncbi:AT-rich interactive domain-containing protein [Trifolium repens]|nr:AT-rich interactive domain-containing protein [Trifolium repens]
MLVNTLPQVEQIEPKKYAFGLFHGRDMMICSKDLACENKSSHHKLQNHKDHVLLNSSSKNTQKRKFDQYKIDGKFATSNEHIGIEKHSSENVKDQTRNPTLSLSCSTPSDGKRVILQGTQEYGFLAQNAKVELCGVCTQDYSHLSNYFDDSIKESSNLMNRANLNIQIRDLMVDSSYSGRTETSIIETPKTKDIDLIQSLKKFLPSRDNHLPRPVIPIGPRFQAEIPKWEGTTDIKKYNSNDYLKWLGTQIWPMPSLSETNAESIGKGRPDSCSCDNPESVDCVKKHVAEARECLKSKIGNAFLSWKFDEMGEDVSKSWTTEEQMKFDSLVKSYLLLNHTKFWKLAMEYFPSKSMKCLINYCYNVYIPRWMSIETRSSFGAVDCEPE